MHAEAVRYGAMPSKPGLIQDESHPVTYAECNVNYRLHYDGDAKTSATFCSALADEIVTARHPDHSSSVVLDLAAIERGQARKQEVVWSIRMPFVSPLKKPGLP